MSRLGAPYLLFWRHRRLLIDVVRQTLRERHAGSVLGRMWLFLGPMLLLGIYALLYTVIFRIKPPGLSIEDYILYIFAGLIPFISFSQGLSAGAVALSQSKSLLLNNIFPAELIPAREVIAGGAFMAVGGGAVLIWKAVTGGAALAWLALPPLVVLFAMATIGLVWAFSLANLVVRDIQHMIGYLMILLMIASPIAFTPDMVPASIKALLYANPLAYYVMSFQSILVLGELPEFEIGLGCVVFAFLMFHLMHRVFEVGKVTLADQI
jgi:lipopolysaccharide transport system permease protein